MIQEHHFQNTHFHIVENPGRHGVEDGQEPNYQTIVHAIAAIGYIYYICRNPSS